MKIDTINVIEYNGIGNLSISSFTEEDFKGAEDLFKNILKEQGITPDNFEYFLEDGKYKDGEYELYLITSY